MIVKAISKLKKTMRFIDLNLFYQNITFDSFPYQIYSSYVVPVSVNDITLWLS